MPAAPRALRFALPALVALALVGCVDQPSPEPEETTSASPTPTVTNVPVPTETPDAEEERPVDAECADLVDADTVYQFNPNFVLLDQWSPPPGSAAEAALDRAGVACRWINQTSGETIDLSVADLPEDQIRQLKNAAFAESQMVPTYGEEAYFEVDGGVGTAIVFEGSYWLVVTSPAFFEPGEPTPFVNSALAALG